MIANGGFLGVPSLFLLGGSQVQFNPEVLGKGWVYFIMGKKIIIDEIDASYVGAKVGNYIPMTPIFNIGRAFNKRPFCFTKR